VADPGGFIRPWSPIEFDCKVWLRPLQRKNCSGEVRITLITLIWAPLSRMAALHDPPNREATKTLKRGNKQKRSINFVDRKHFWGDNFPPCRSSGSASGKRLKPLCNPSCAKIDLINFEDTSCSCSGASSRKIRIRCRCQIVFRPASRYFISISKRFIPRL